MDGLCATTSAEQENPRPLRLSSTTTTALSHASLSPNSPEHSHNRILADLSPSNPAILLTRSLTDPDSRPFVCSAITIISSARTVELYISDEYAGTFRGETFLPSTPSLTPTSTGGAGPASPPLFLIQIDQESLLHRCRNLLFKFFIPKKPAAFQDSLTIHWLIVQGALPPPSPSPSLTHGPIPQNTPQLPTAATSSSSEATVHTPVTSTPALPSPFVSSLPSTSVQLGNSPSLTQSDTTSATVTAAADNAAGSTTTTNYSDASTTSASHISSGYSSSQNPDNQTSPNFSAFPSAHSYMMSSAMNNATSIDLDKVRQLLSQVQIDNMPQGAKDLMRTMEMQFLAQQHPKASSSLAGGRGTTTAKFTPPSGSPTIAAVGGTMRMTEEATTTFVTKAELALLEERIMAKIDQRFQDMEDRILNKLLLATQQPKA
ncbi:hypothetical protein BGZ97_007187 [Linnemannia gamsii]|uniref:Uncharacterized protein n=1 Tax=Linnemannia gamsii TaxID=64522 RepID=A0A9P6RB31_9FUNG|nr:hypothetical protein BGZ97_007187 [Linnemannia gamsii]